MMRVGVDRITEQHELHDGHAEHHGEGQPVAAKLLDLLDHDGAQSAPEAAAPHHAPGALSCAFPMRWMNTSSSVGSASFQSMPSVRSGLIAASSGSRSGPETCK